jgi:hypothetical protein
MTVRRRRSGAAPHAPRRRQHLRHRWRECRHVALRGARPCGRAPRPVKDDRTPAAPLGSRRPTARPPLPARHRPRLSLSAQHGRWIPGRALFPLLTACTVSFRRGSAAESRAAGRRHRGSRPILA